VRQSSCSARGTTVGAAHARSPPAPAPRSCRIVRQIVCVLVLWLRKRMEEGARALWCDACTHVWVRVWACAWTWEWESRSVRAGATQGESERSPPSVWRSAKSNPLAMARVNVLLAPVSRALAVVFAAPAGNAEACMRRVGFMPC
jgi:hypothetical protein